MMELNRNKIALEILCAIMPTDKTELLLDKPDDRVSIAFVYADAFIKYQLENGQ